MEHINSPVPAIFVYNKLFIKELRYSLCRNKCIFKYCLYYNFLCTTTAQVGQYICQPINQCMESAIIKFQNAWLSLDAESINACVSDDVNYAASPSGNSFSGRTKLSEHFSGIFKYLMESNARTQLVSSTPNMLLYKYRFESLWPVTQYMVNSDGIFLVPCLENRIITLDLKVKYAVKNNQISKIKIIEKKNIECTINA